MIPELITSMIDDGIYPFDKYGSVTCVSVIENTTTPKTRGLAVRECRICVDNVGLSAVGKKGIVVIAKAYSDETLTENKSAFLDLIEAIILKMNGDVKKFIKFCGASNLSSKARATIEKRMTQKKVSTSSQRQNHSSQPSGVSSASAIGRSSLREETSNRNSVADNDGPFKFSFNSSTNINGSERLGSVQYTEPVTKNLSPEQAVKREANSGAAASLRERLKQIRDRHQPDHDINSSPVPSSLQTSVSRELSPTPPSPNTYLRSIMDDVDELLSQDLPLGKNTEKSSVTLIGLRKIHASLTNGSTDSTGTDPLILKQLKEEIASKASFCVFKLAR